MNKIFKSRGVIILLTAVLMIFTLCACNTESKSIGIIGGADGPTAIFVARTVASGIAENVLVSPFRILWDFGLLRHLQGSAAYIAVAIAMYVLVALIGYALGSLNFGIIISKLIYKDDIRKYGSGNAGTTNMLRTFGKGAAIGTILGDALKVVVAILISYLLVGSYGGGGYVAGLFAIIGHVYPIFYGFKGGKGVVAAAITILMLDYMSFLVVLTVFVLVVVIWRYISLGSIISAALYPMITYVRYGSRAGLEVVFAFLIAVFVIVLHRTNIQRLIEGKENKLSFKKSGKKSVKNSDKEEK